MLDVGRYSVSEILRKASLLKEEEQKVNYLRNNRSDAMLLVLKMALDPDIKWILPVGDPPYTPNDLPEQYTRLYVEAKRLYIFIVGGGKDNMDQRKRENLFIEILETVDPNDAKLLCAAKEKTIPFEGYDLEFIEKVFPGLIAKKKS